MKFLKLKVVLILAAIFLFLMGLGLTIVTTTMLGSMGYDANPASIHLARAVGASFIAFAVMAWFGRNSASDPAQALKALVIGFSVLFFLGATVDARGIIAGTIPLSGWFTDVGPWVIFFVLIVITGRSAMAEES